MDYYKLKYGLWNDAPDLLENLPALGKLKTKDPVYIERAENAQKTARKFAKDHILPNALEIDKKCSTDPRYMDWDLWRKANQAKLNIAPIPEKMGGLGWSALDNAVLVEELTSACIGCASNITFNTFGLLGAMVECRTGVVLRIIREMVAAQRAEKPLFWSWAITEPGAGTDMEDGEAMVTMRPSAHAKKVHGGYSISGTKCFITNGSLAHYVIAAVPTDPASPRDSMATFLISTASKGFSTGRVERKCGQKASQTAELFFNDVFVPDENVWEPLGQGLRHTREILSITRGYIGLVGLGIARGALERCIQYSYQKKIKGHRLIDEEWVKFAIADILKDIMTMRSACVDFAIALDTYHVWRLFGTWPVKASLTLLSEKMLLSESTGAFAQSTILSNVGNTYKNRLVTDEVVEKFVKYGSAIKVAGTDLAVKVTSKVADIVGMEGMAYRYGIEKSFRDAKVSQIYEGTNQANLLDVFKHEIGGLLPKNGIE